MRERTGVLVPVASPGERKVEYERFLGVTLDSFEDMFELMIVVWVGEVESGKRRI
jgi:hypothetical protein